MFLDAGRRYVDMVRPFFAVQAEVKTSSKLPIKSLPQPQLQGNSAVYA